MITIAASSFSFVNMSIPTMLVLVLGNLKYEEEVDDSYDTIDDADEKELVLMLNVITVMLISLLLILIY